MLRTRNEWSPLIVDGFLNRVLEAADRILNLASDLLRLAFGFELGVAGHFARDFLNLALGLLDGALDSIFVHVFLSLLGSTFPRRLVSSLSDRFLERKIFPSRSASVILSRSDEFDAQIRHRGGW